MKPTWARFVSEYIKSGNVTQSSRLAGISKRTGQSLLNRPEIQDALKAVQKEFMEEAKYGLHSAMKEIDDAMEFARQTENATALASLLQLKSKINGLVIDRTDHRMTGNVSFHFEGIDNSKAVGPAILIGGDVERDKTN